MLVPHESLPRIKKDHVQTRDQVVKVHHSHAFALQ